MVASPTRRTAVLFACSAIAAVAVGVASVVETARGFLTPAEQTRMADLTHTWACREALSNGIAAVAGPTSPRSLRPLHPRATVEGTHAVVVVTGASETLRFDLDRPTPADLAAFEPSTAPSRIAAGRGGARDAQAADAAAVAAGQRRQAHGGPAMTTPTTTSSNGAAGAGRPTPRGRGPVINRAGGWRRVALATVASGVIGAGALAAILFATGAVDRGTSAVTPVLRTGATAAASPLNAPALYASAAPGVVDITAQTPSQLPNPSNPASPSRQQSTATGTGIVIDGRGDILTADHVVRGTTSVTIRFSNGTSRTARLLGQDPSTDLAVLHVDPAGLTLHPLALGDASALAVGDPIAAIGDPFDYARSMSTGIVSGLDRTIQALNGFSVGHAIQTDAAIDPGNSGGPLLNARGQVVGVVDQIAIGKSGADTSTGVGFAVSINVAKAELAQLERGARVGHAYLSVETAPAVGTSNTNGVLVQAVAGAGPAAKAGTRSGDVIESAAGRPLLGVNDLISTIARSSARPGADARRPARLTTSHPPRDAGRPAEQHDRRLALPARKRTP